MQDEKPWNLSAAQARADQVRANARAGLARVGSQSAALAAVLQEHQDKVRAEAAATTAAAAAEAAARQEAKAMAERERIAAGSLAASKGTKADMARARQQAALAKEAVKQVAERRGRSPRRRREAAAPSAEVLASPTRELVAEPGPVKASCVAGGEGPAWMLPSSGWQQAPGAGDSAGEGKRVVEPTASRVLRTRPVRAAAAPSCASFPRCSSGCA